MTRRDVLKRAGIVAAAAVTGPFFHVRPARADKGDLVVVSWGGDYDQALRDFVFPAFEKATGYTVKLDAPPETAKVKAMQTVRRKIGARMNRHLKRSNRARSP